MILLRARVNATLRLLRQERPWVRMGARQRRIPQVRRVVSVRSDPAGGLAAPEDAAAGRQRPSCCKRCAVSAWSAGTCACPSTAQKRTGSWERDNQQVMPYDSGLRLTPRYRISSYRSVSVRWKGACREIDSSVMVYRSSQIRMLQMTLVKWTASITGTNVLRKCRSPMMGGSVMIHMAKPTKNGSNDQVPREQIGGNK